MGILNPKHLYLQERPDKYGGNIVKMNLISLLKMHIKRVKQ